jgi:hypothetical protein
VTKKRKKGEKPKSRFVVARRADIAEFFGVSLDAVDKWRERKMPGEPSAWDLAVIAKWLRERESALRKRQQSDDPGRRLKSAKASLAVLELREQRGLLIRKAEHERYCISLCQILRESFLSLPPTLGIQVEGKSAAEATAIILEGVKDVLSNLAYGGDGEREKSAADGSDGDRADSPARARSTDNAHG